MLKLKRLIPAMLSVIFAFAIFTSACQDGQDGQSAIDQNALVGISLVTNNVKKSYELGDQFTSENLVVNAIMKDIDSGLETPKDVTAEAKVDSSEFDSGKVGKYSIFVSYSHAGVTRSDSYDVIVNAAEPAFGGISVEYVADFVNQTVLSESAPTATIPLDKLVVKKVGANGTVGETLTANDYNVDLYLGTEKQSSWTVGGGAYTLLVSLKSDPKVTNFVNYYVVDKLTGLVWKSDAEGTVKEIEQWASDNAVRQMASTWVFEAQYVSGAKKTLTIADAGVSYTCNVESAGAKTVQVKYVGVNAIGAAESATANVSITVKSLEGSNTITHTYSFSELQSKMKELLERDPIKGDVLNSTYFTGANSFLKFVDEGSDANSKYTTDSKGCIEIKGGRLQVTFTGKGYIEIGFHSTSGSNTSGLALLDSNGNYMYGIVKSGNAVGLAEEDEFGNPAGLFIVTGSDETIVKFSVEEAGTYTIYSVYNYGAQSRGCRLKSVTMVDVVSN